MGGYLHFAIAVREECYYIWCIFTKIEFLAQIKIYMKREIDNKALHDILEGNCKPPG